MEIENKIGGWLTVFAIVLPLQILVHASYVFRGIRLMINKDFIALQADFGQQYANLVKYSGTFITISSLLLFIGILIVNYHFFKKSRSFVRIFIFVNSISLVLSFVSEFLGGLISGHQPAYMTSTRLLIFLIISFIYLKLSKRVKATFVG